MFLSYSVIICECLKPTSNLDKNKKKSNLKQCNNDFVSIIHLRKRV